MKKNLRRYFILIFIFLTLAATRTEAVTKAEFIAGLLKARGIDWSETSEFQNKSPVAFMLRSGLITDDVKDIQQNVTRREALRWIIQSLGLSFEAGLFSDYPTGFNDDKNLSPYERGCLVVTSNMNPAIFSKSENFNGKNALSTKEFQILMSRVNDASQNLTLDMVRNPLKGLRVFIHREGVLSGIPNWRFYADGIKTRPAADTLRKSLSSSGIEAKVFTSEGTFGVRTEKLESYHEIKKLISVAKARGLSFRVLPSFSNIKTEIVPEFWITLKIDPTYWKILPLISKNSTKDLLTLSQISKQYGSKTSINAGFFSVTNPGRGFPIGALKINGTLINEPVDNRGCVGWNDDNEANFDVVINSEEINEWYGLENIIQAGPLLLNDGEVPAANENFNNSLTSVRHPRTVVGVNSEGDWVFVVVDGRNGLHSSGMTLSELTEMLRTQGITHALNLDGGGSTEIIINGKIYNSPSDGRERKISTAIAVLPREN